MRQSASGRYFNAVSLCGIKGAKAFKLCLLFACCLLVTACPPAGGDLVPLVQGEGAELFTTKLRNDTLLITHGEVSIKARGLWSIADSNTSVILAISNANAEALTVDFNRSELVNSDSHEKLSLVSVSDETDGDGPAFLSDRIVKVNGGQEKRFALEFKIIAADARSSVPRNVLGQTVTLKVPVLMKDEVDFVFAFKYAEGQQ